MNRSPALTTAFPARKGGFAGPTGRPRPPAARSPPRHQLGRHRTPSLRTTGEFALPVTVTPALPAVATFAELDMPAALLETLTRRGLTEPFPIQAATLPNSLAGRDVLGRGRTGSGKTLAFGLALLARTAGQRAEPGSRWP